MRHQQSPGSSSVPGKVLQWRPGRWALLVFCVLAAIIGGPAHSASAQFGGLNATLTASPSSVAVGQVVTFAYSATPPAVAPPFASITSTSISYGDGQSDSGNTSSPGQTASGAVTHVYTSPGTYTAFLSASASNGASGSATASVTVGGGGGGGLAPSVIVTAFPPTAAAGQPVSFNYSATTSFGIGFTSIKSMLISYGDGGAPLPLTPPSGTVSHTYFSPGFYNILVTATDTNNQQGQATATVQVGSGGGGFGPPTNVQIVNPPFTATAGQPVGFNAATASVNNPGAFIQSYVWNYSDGGSDFGQSVSHVFSSPGTYTVTLTVTDSTGASAQTSTTISVSSGAPPPAPGVSVTYQPGWNIVAAQTGASIAGASLPLYTFQNGDTVYRTASTTQAGLGYWAYFNSPSTVTVPFTGPQTITKALQPSQFVMIGNSSSSLATVSGADVVYAYSATSGYQMATTLQPGQGAWALSYSGANVTITSTGR